MNCLKAFNILLSYKRIFDKLNITFWLDGGTCLGAYRDNNFPDGDFDVDVGIYGEDAEKIPQIVEAMREDGFSHFHIKEHPSGIGKQISSIKDGIPNDVFVYFLRGDKRFRVMFDISPLRTVRYIPCVLPRYIFDSFKHIDFMDYGVEFNVPERTGEYLERQYGDWRTNKTNREFHWQTDYGCMDMAFEVSPHIPGRRLWMMTNSLNADLSNVNGTDFLRELIKEGIKLSPIVVDKSRNVLDGKKRLKIYRERNIPMVEVICTGEVRENATTL